MRSSNRSLRPTKSNFDLQGFLSKFDLEFHVPGYQFLGPGTRFKERVKKGQKGVNRLDRVAFLHDKAYGRALNIDDKWKADRRMISRIKQFPGRKSWTERTILYILGLKLYFKI